MKRVPSQYLETNYSIDVIKHLICTLNWLDITFIDFVDVLVAENASQSFFISRITTVHHKGNYPFWSPVFLASIQYIFLSSFCYAGLPFHEGLCEDLYPCSTKTLWSSNLLCFKPSHKSDLRKDLNFYNPWPSFKFVFLLFSAFMQSAKSFTITWNTSKLDSSFIWNTSCNMFTWRFIIWTDFWSGLISWFELSEVKVSFTKLTLSAK